MALKKIAVDGYEVSITQQSGASPGDWTNEFSTILEQKSMKCKAESKELLKGPIIIKKASGCSLSGFDFIIGVATLSPNSSKSKCEVVPGVLRMSHYTEGATGSCAGIHFKMMGVIPVTIPCSCQIKIKTAGQDKCTSEA